MRPLRHAAADWCFLPSAGDPEAYYRALAHEGFTAVEMVAAEHRPLARGAGLVLLTGSGPGMEQGLNRREHHPQLIPRITEAIHAAANDGVQNLILFSGVRAGLSDDAGISACISALQELRVIAERHRVGLLLEVLNEIDHPDHQCSRMAFAMQVVSAVASPRVRILYDLYHATRMGEDAGELALRHLPLIGHLHVASCARRGRPRLGQLPDYPVIVRRLQQAGYDGWWGHEFIPEGPPLKELGVAKRFLDDANAGMGPSGAAPLTAATR